MKYLILLILLVLNPINEIDKIARTNELKKDAKEAYQAGNYEVAIQKYHYLLDSMGIKDEGIVMNLANAYYQHADTTSAENYYSQLRENSNPQLASRAYQQLGVIKNSKNQFKEALQDFKQALRKDPTNEEARYNYELLKKLIKEQEEQQKEQDKKQDKQEQKKEQEQEQKQDQQQKNDQDQQKKEEQQKQDQQKQDQEGKEGEEQQKDQQQKDEQQKKEGEEQQKKNEGKPEEPSDEENQEQKDKNDMNISPDKLKEMKISEEKARMILEAMKNQEVQYIQQNKRKATKPQSSNKPDW